MVSELELSSTDAIGVAQERIAWLEARLQQAEATAAERIGKLERQLEQARCALPTARDAAAVAANLAAQQQVDALRAALHEKDRVMETLNQTIRELEDKLEDHYRELDRLLLKVSQYERERAEAEARAERAERRAARAEAQAVAQAANARPLADAAGLPRVPDPGSGVAPAVHERQAQAGVQIGAQAGGASQGVAAARQDRRSGSLRLLIALLLVVVGLGILGGLWWFTQPLPGSRGPGLNPIGGPLGAPTAGAGGHG